MGLFNKFFKKRKITLINDQINICLTNGTQLVIDGATKHEYDVLSYPELTDFEVINYYWTILDRIKQEKAEKAEPAEKSMMQIIEKKEEQKQKEEQILVEARKEVEYVKNFQSRHQNLIATGDFYEENGCLYMTGIPLSIPKLLVRKFIELDNINACLVEESEDNTSNREEYEALKRFWAWCSLCPNSQSREDLFKFISRYNLKINKNGFFFAYRRVVSKKDEKKDVELSNFISNSFIKIKGQKKSPKNFSVYTGDDFEGYKYCENTSIPKPSFQERNNTIIGNLADMYELLKEEVEDVVTYTDNHTHTFDIRIGREVSIPAEECDWDNTNPCSAGLHLVVDKDHGCGDTMLLVLVNPMHSISVPISDASKMRVRAYLPLAVLDESEFLTILDTMDTTELGDDYLIDQVDKLQEMINSNNPSELIHHAYLPQVSPETLKLLEEKVVDIKQVLKDRTVKI